jgi:hypothetical protein
MSMKLICDIKYSLHIAPNFFLNKNTKHRNWVTFNSREIKIGCQLQRPISGYIH